MKAPNFSLPDQNGNIKKLSDYLGKYIVMYFYPKDDTPGCTKEACNFRDSYKEIEKLGAIVIGVSKDTIKSHKKFADKYNLTFPLLSDETTETIKAFGAWGKKKFMGREYEGINRNTYIISPNGEIIKNFLNVNPIFHAKEIIDVLKSYL